MPHSPRECEPPPVRAAAPGPQSPSPKCPGSLRLLLLTIHLHRAGWCGWINLHLVELSLSVVQVKLKVVKLVLQEDDRSVTIHHHVLKLVYLAVELGDQSTPALELVAGLTKLLAPQLDGQV